MAVCIKSQLAAHGFAYFNPLWLSLIVLTVLSVCQNLSAQQVIIPVELRQRYEERTFVGTDSVEHRYRILLPPGFDPAAGKQYPLVLILHGAGERGDDNALQLKHAAAEFARADRQADYPCIVIVPQVPLMKRWVEVDWTKPTGKGTFLDESTPAITAAIGMVEQWIKSGNVDSSRVYVTGISMGGYGIRSR